MDVPLNHWAYDAIGQLAAQGILSGYPDGTYKGKQPTTRYEMASALARALAVVDLTKASKADVEMLKRLVIEFKDELDALGVKVDELDKRVAVIESRLGGWKISGVLRNDLLHTDSFTGAKQNDNEESRGYGDLARARLFLDRWFGEDESIHFHARVEGSDGAYANASSNLAFTRFYAEIPAFYDTKLIVGRFAYDFEGAYYLDGKTPFSKLGVAGTDHWMGSGAIDAFGIQKNFGLGSVTFYVAHPLLSTENTAEVDEWIRPWAKTGFSVWEFALNGQFQFNEQFGFDLGIQAFMGDDAAKVKTEWLPGNDTVELNKLWTAYVGIRFDFSDSIALRGLFFHQARDLEDGAGNDLSDRYYDGDNSNAFKFVVDVKQELLSFTSLWLEYNHLEEGFFVRNGRNALFNDGDFGKNAAAGYIAPGNFVIDDLTIWRIAAEQEWNDKWSTFLFFANFDLDDVDVGFKHYGLGVNYQLNPSVILGLSYAVFNYDDDFPANDESQIRFRTQVTF
jgi:hypothetical protein